MIRKAEFMGQGKAPERQEDIALQLSQAIEESINDTRINDTQHEGVRACL